MIETRQIDPEASGWSQIDPGRVNRTEMRQIDPEASGWSQIDPDRVNMVEMQ